jgi:outer membrane receptor protein involved in Fe transport
MYAGLTDVRANFGTAFRLPTAEEPFANDPYDERRDPNLKPGRATMRTCRSAALRP